ncbi:MAG: tRNA pseudouridine(55) synthase TruB [Clostridia bacterium]|nr:tRNA pseudouridine(55) synthase TruB [Clostridia bacterium]
MQGLLLIDKPQNKTSYGAVACVKRISGEKRVGHTGTLDPMAAGVLPVLLGRATALSSYLLEADKRYTARVRLGVCTDTCDITGNVLSEKAVNVSPEKLNEGLRQFVGPQAQTPPMFSALKKDGVRLYDLARQGKSVEIEPRQIVVYSITQTAALENDEFEIDVLVSKGTYIRSLARDIGEALGCGATLTALRRTATCGFSIADCVALDNLNGDNLKQYLLPAETVVERFRAATATEKQSIRFCNGGQLDFDRLKGSFAEDGELIRVRWNDVFLGLGRVNLAEHRLDIQCIVRE